MYLTKARVHKIEAVTRDCFTLFLKEKNIAEKAVPGQFVHIRLSPGLYPLLRRPFSIAGTVPAQETFRLLVRAVGEGTRFLQNVQEGQSLDCLGPLGSGFLPRMPPYVLVAGGIGVAPLVFLAQHLSLENHPLTFYYGTASAQDRVPLQMWLPDSVQFIEATEDGSVGYQGRVTDALHNEIRKGNMPGEIFACGPAPMLREMVRLNAGWGVPMQVSLEERMACGTGACQGCVVEIDREKETDFLRVCREGPVFDADKVVEFRGETKG